MSLQQKGEIDTEDPDRIRGGKEKRWTKLQDYRADGRLNSAQGGGG